jgi:hypothetical protein
MNGKSQRFERTENHWLSIPDDNEAVNHFSPGNDSGELADRPTAAG